jgi:hypothetical protein
MHARFASILITSMLASSVGLAVAQTKKAAGAAAGPASSAAQPAAAAASPSSSAAIESQMLAFGALDHIASAVAATVCKDIPDPWPLTPASPGVPAIPAVPRSTVVIYDLASFASLQSYEAFIANAGAIVSLYETLLPNSGDPNHNDKATLNGILSKLAPNNHPNRPAPRALGLSSTIDPFSDATSMLSAIAIASNTESPGSIVIPDSAMAVAVTRQLAGTGGCPTKISQVIYPPLFGNASSTDFSSADIQSDLQVVQVARDFVVKAVDLQTKGNPATTADGVLTSALTDVNGMYDTFLNSLLQVNSSTGIVGSAAVIQGYQLANALAGPVETNGSYLHPAFILLASILSAGGTERDHKNIWTALWSGDKITYSGGLVVNVALWHSDDKMPIYSGLLRFRAPFSNILNPKNQTDLTAGDNLPNP